jgi:GT2 family glycosyltransferase
MTVPGHRLSVVIPSYNALGSIEPLLVSLARMQRDYPGGMQIVISDDASTDGTVPELRLSYPQFAYREGRENLGFGGNVNAGAEMADAQYLAIVNTDIELLGDPFGPLIALLQSDDGLFAAMPLVWNTHFDKVENLQSLLIRRGLAWNTDQAVAGEYTQLMRELLEQAAHPAERLADIGSGRSPIPGILCGAMFVCSRARFTKLGGFDARYRPFYWEDVGLGYEARRRGWQCATLPSVAVLHRHSETINRHHAARKLDYLLMNQLRFVHRNRDQLPGLGNPRPWWLLRSLRPGSSRELRQAYMQAALGRGEV